MMHIPHIILPTPDAANTPPQVTRSLDQCAPIIDSASLLQFR